MLPRRPAHLSPYAEAVLEGLARQGLGDHLSLGGGLALLHYLDYRQTFDADAWWEPDVSAEDRRRVLACAEEVLSRFGEVRRKSWGEVVRWTRSKNRKRGSRLNGSVTGSKRNSFMASWIDPALYPDQETPERLDSLADRVDFLARLCGAWDFGRLPEMATVREVRRHEWREAVAGAEILTSPTYHLLRDWHGLPTRPFLGRKLAWICEDPSFEFV